MTRTMKARSHGTPPLEWLLGTVGALLLGGAVVFLAYQGVTGNDTPGAVIVNVDAVHDVGSSYLVEFTVRNAGSQPLSQLHLVARLTDRTGEIESARVFVDYLAGHSQQEAGVYLRQDPRRYTLEISPAGFMKP